MGWGFGTVLNEFRKFSPWEDCSLSRKPKGLTDALTLMLQKAYLWSQRTNLIRYYPVVKIIKKASKNVKILEIGSGPLGITRYVKNQVYGVDLKTAGPKYDNMILTKVSAESLPFKDGFFDYVICIDMLEHIPGTQRQQVVNEMLRVAKGQIFLGVPCRETAQVWEDKAKKAYQEALKKLDRNQSRKEMFIKRNTFLWEHEQYGLPTDPEIREYIKNSGRNISFDILENESVWVWYYGLLGDMKYNYFRWIITVIVFALFFNLFAGAKWGGCYRKIYKIRKTGA